MMNPYSWNSVNPDLCFGRDGLISEMLSGLPGSPRFSFGLAGGRRMGKTTILRRIEKELISSIQQWKSGGLLVIPIYIDLLALPEAFTATDVWTFIARKVTEHLEISNPPEIQDFDRFKSVLQTLLINAVDRPRVIVLFDEIEHIVASDWGRSFFDHWRALLSNTPGVSEYFTAVFSGAKEMQILRREGVGSPLMDILELRNLRVLEYEDICRLMQEPIDYSWPEAFMQKIYQEAGGHPMLTQYIMQRVCSSDLEHAEEASENAINKFVKDRSWQFSEWWNKYCTATARTIYARLPENGHTIPKAMLTNEFGTPEANEALEILQHVGLITEEEEGFAFRYSGKMYRRWFNKYGKSTSLPSSDKTLYSELLQITDQTQANNYLDAWKNLDKAGPEKYYDSLEKIKTVFDELVKAKAVGILGGDLPYTDKPATREVITELSKLRNSENLGQIISDYELLNKLSQKYEKLNLDVRNGAGNTNALLKSEMNELMKQWDNLIIHFIRSFS
jgi:hypothetical protein